MNINWIISIVLVLASAASANVTPTNKFEHGLLETLERWRSGYHWALPVELPPLARLALGPRTLRTGDGYTLELGDVSVRGLERLRVTELSASAAHKWVYAEFSVPELIVTSDYYHLTGSFWMFPIDRSGELRVTARGVSVTALVRLGARSSDPVREAQLGCDVNTLTSELTNGGFVVNDRFRSGLARALSQGRVRARAEAALRAALRKALVGIDPAQLIDAISNA